MLRDGFTQVPNEVLDDNTVSVPARFLYSVLLSFAWDNNEVYPGQNRLAESLGVSDKSIRTYLVELEKKGYLIKKRRGLNHTNIYTLNKWIPTGYERKKVPIKKQKKSSLKKGSQLPSNNTQVKKTQIDQTQSESSITHSPLSSDEIIANCKPHLKRISLKYGIEIDDLFALLKTMALHYSSKGESFPNWVARFEFWIVQDLKSEKISRSPAVVQEAELTHKWNELEEVIVSIFGENWRQNEGLSDEIKRFIDMSGGLTSTPVEELQSYLEFFKKNQTAAGISVKES